MSVLVDVIREEENRLIALQEMYDQKLSDYPKGSFSVKKRSSGEYCYLSFRENKRVKSVYIGKKDSDQAREVAKKIAERRRIERKLAEVKSNLKEAEVLLRAVK